MQLDKAIKQRRSVRNFSNKKPNWKDIIECVDAARYAPMAGGMYTLNFIIIDKPEIIEKLAIASQQNFVADAQYVVAFITNPDKTKRAYPERAERYLKHQEGAAIQNFLLKIVEKKLSTCWVEEFVDEQVDKILDLPASKYTVALFPIGYTLKKSKKEKEKINMDNILYFNNHGNKHLKVPKKSNA
ncbi:nitroreductase family protein [archaeon]|jgi:nitroreductase|nr:nitroreductase family protein [archaeon]MBT4373817.1 nitroreductase family protein [archaeon]MBT4532283.1 nitroreductase family protein [archaeon]MBT7001108.1 nitroreductase family protein [archaeon]MBT7281997.1 nitroreductase family protein [archaeon]